MAMKPTYIVPTMQDVKRLPMNGLKAVSTFSGCGGSCLGLRMAGFDIKWANEFVPAAQQTYIANNPDTFLDTRDIRQVKGSEILAHVGMEVGELDLFEGSPPCASFSTSGKRHRGWGKQQKYSDTAQRTDDLFWEWARLLHEIQPRAFVAENVSGLVKGVAVGYFKELVRLLKHCGYNVCARMLDAQFLGVPQARQRIIFIGIRDDLKLSPEHPVPLGYRYTVREVLPHIARIKLSGAPNRWATSDRPASTVLQSDGARASMTGYLSSYVVETTEGERRKWTIEELKVISSFPEDFILSGDFGQQWERIGRAVPPVMMMHVGKAIEKVLKRCQK